MDSHFKVTGYTLSERSYSPSHRTDYEFVVVFKSWQDNQTNLENFLSWYLDWKEERDGRPYHLFCDETCARGLGVFFLRERMIRLWDDYAERSPTAVLPAREPDAQDAGYRLWVVKETRAEVYTESNAGWDLYERCQHFKLPVAEARSFVHAKFNGKGYDWDEVLRWFRNNGGRHTDKYLRVDR